MPPLVGAAGSAIVAGTRLGEAEGETLVRAEPTDEGSGKDLKAVSTGRTMRTRLGCPAGLKNKTKKKKQ